MRNLYLIIVLGIAMANPGVLHSQNNSLKASNVLTEKMRYELNNPSEAIRLSGYVSIYTAARDSTDIEDHYSLVELLVDGLNDSSLAIRTSAGKWLLEFGKASFNEGLKDRLKEQLATGGLSRHEILIAGVAGIVSRFPEIRRLAGAEVRRPQIGKWYGTDVWAAILATGRSGEEWAVRKAVSIHEDEEDLIYRATTGLEELAYMRHPLVLEVLSDYLISNERLPQLKESIEGELVAFRAAAIMASLVEGFPVDKKYFGDITDQELQICRDWVNEHSGYLEIKETLSK